MSVATTVVRAADEGELRHFWGGGMLEFKATAAETGGAFMLFEDSMQLGKTTPLHVHEREDELLYVLEGEILVHVDGGDHALGAGGVALAPRGVPHAFLVTSPTARVLTLQTPGSAEAFYRDASEPTVAGVSSTEEVDFDRVLEAARKSGGMRVVGPPPFATDGSAAG